MKGVHQIDHHIELKKYYAALEQYTDYIEQQQTTKDSPLQRFKTYVGGLFKRFG